MNLNIKEYNFRETELCKGFCCPFFHLEMFQLFKFGSFCLCLQGFVTSVETCFMRGGCVVISITRVVIAQRGPALSEKNLFF